MKKLINYGKHTIGNEEIKNIKSVLKSNFLTQGSQTLNFEKSLMKKFGSKYVTSVCNGTAGLYIAIRSLNLKKNSTIAIPSITFVGAANSIVLAGHIPLFVDINYETNCIDVNHLEKILIRKKIHALIVVDLGGQPANWESIKKLSTRKNFYLINDNCHGIGSKYSNSEKYALKYADISVQSYHPVKAITTAEGGAILTNNKKLANVQKLLRNNSMVNSKNHWSYQVNNISLHFRISDVHAAIGLAQLKKLNSFVKIRQKLAKNYYNLFKNYEKIKLPFVNSLKITNSFHLFIVKYNFKNKVKKNTFFKKMLKDNVRIQFHYTPIYRFSAYKKYKLKKNQFINSEKYMKNAFTIPIYPELKYTEQKRIVNSIIKHLYS